MTTLTLTQSHRWLDATLRALATSGEPEVGDYVHHINVADQAVADGDYIAAYAALALACAAATGDTGRSALVPLVHVVTALRAENG